MKTQIAQATETLNHAELEAYIKTLEVNNFQQIMGVHLKTHPTDFLMKSKIDGSINPYWSNFKNKEVIKDQHKRVPLLTDYQLRVNRNSEKEGIEEEFIAEAPKGKEHISKCIYTDTATHTKRYIAFEYFEEIKDKAPIYLINGSEVDYQLLANYHNREKKKAEQNGIKRKVNIFAPLFDSIVSIKNSGILYIIDHR
jgi:hypothetical protein